MKKADLTVQQLIAWKGFINDAVSAGVVQIGNKNFTVKSETVFVAGWLSGLKNGEILISGNKIEQGKRSIEGNVLPAGTYQLIEATRTLFDTTKVAENDANLLACAFASVAPVEFRNGMVTYSQGSELLKLAGTDATNFRASTGNDADFREIAPVLFRPLTKASINFELAGAAPANAAYKHEYRCITFTESDKS